MAETIIDAQRADSLLAAWRAQLRALRTTLAGVAATAALLIGTLVALHQVKEIPYFTMTGDPNAVTYAPFYVGFFSQAGILFWAAAAAISCFAATIRLAEAGRCRSSNFLIASAALSSIVGLDDAFLLHDAVYPQLLGLPKLAVICFYAGLVSLYLVAFRRQVLESDYLLLGLALAFFALSVGFDTFPPAPHVAALYEDGAKMLGILCWLAYHARCAAQTLMPKSAAGSP